jgi:hypothetical protein
MYKYVLATLFNLFIVFVKLLVYYSYYNLVWCLSVLNDCFLYNPRQLCGENLFSFTILFVFYIEIIR